MSPNKKVTKEIGLRSAEFCAPAQKAASLRIHRHAFMRVSEHLNGQPTSCTLAVTLLSPPCRKKLQLQTYNIVARRGIPKGAALVREQPASAPLWLTSFGTFLVQRQEKYITACSAFCTPKVIHRPCGMWREFLWKFPQQNFIPHPLWKSSSFQHCPCGEKHVAALAKKGLFHITLYYGCYD